MDLGKIMTTIVDYNKVLIKYGYLETSNGATTWSVRHTNEKTGWYVDIRNLGWKFFAGKIIMTGNTPTGLENELKEFQESKA